MQAADEHRSADEVSKERRKHNVEKKRLVHVYIAGLLLAVILLYGNPSCTEIHKSIIIESTITYINATGRFI